MKKEFVIEKNIPIQFWHKDARWANLARQMEEGDSVLLDNYKEVHSLGTALHKLGARLIRRKQPDGKIRAWRGEAILKLPKQTLQNTSARTVSM